MKNWLVRIDFLDHATSSWEESGLSREVVWGIVVQEDAESIRLCTWAVDGNPQNSDSETVSLVKHPSMKIERIREEKIGE